jgi:hypothetical protein
LIRFLKSEQLKLILLMLGPLAFSLGNFVATLAIQITTNSSEFGIYAFIIVLSAIAMASSNALFASPLAIMTATEETEKKIYLVFAWANTIFCLLVFPLACAVLVFLDQTWSTVTLGSISIVANSYRWHKRSEFICLGRRNQATLSDILFGAVLSLSSAVLLYTDQITGDRALGLQIIAFGVSLIPIWRSAGLEKTEYTVAEKYIYFRKSFKELGKWSIANMLAAEMTVNSHSYIVTLLLGPHSFAPIATATLFFRPVQMTITSLNQFERPRLAKLFETKNYPAAIALLNTVTNLSLTIYAFNVFLVVAVLYFLPHLFLRNGYDIKTLVFSSCAFAIIALIKISYSARIVAIQALGKYRDLTTSYFIAFPIALILVLGLILRYPNFPAASLAAITLGEVIIYFSVKKSFQNAKLNGWSER